MSEATIFEFPYNLFIKQRLEFVVICHDQIAAAIMRIVECEMIKQKEAWQNKVTTAVEGKKTPPKEPAEYWVRLSHGQIIAKLYYYDSGKLEKPGEEATEEEIKEYLRKKGISLSKTTIRRTINLLIDLGFLLMRSKPGDEFGAPLYTLHRKNVQKALKSLPANPFSIFNQWEGVSNLEGGVSKLESGELAESEEGVSNLESPHFPKTKVNKDNKEISSKTSKDNLKEDTDATSSDDCATPSPSFSENASHEENQQSTPSSAAEPTSDEIAKLNRLTNPPEPLTEQNVDADESPREIASETANDTASLPVVESVVIHADARNDGDSYSPPSTAKNTPETEQSNFGVNQSEVTERAETPATGKGAGKRSGGKGGNKKTTKPDLSPIAPPARPDSDAPFNAEKILAWGDYGRKALLPESNRRDSRAFKAIEAARKIEGFGISEDLFLTLYFNWMKGVKVDLTDLPEGAIKSDTWPDYTVDLWVFAQYFEQERKRYNDRKKEVERVALKAQQLAKGIVSTATKIAGYTRQFDTDDDEDIVYESKAEKTQRKRA